ncbi:type IV conjugative transfer system pilin TraA [Duffyella gerundensis]|uniref:type IV conjugative transfer system pilin TraA n=1 Tax=Duffyella gerundensis TaxID=1619313 RepID=UPI00165414C6|nr:type IV conjugative transfer system pilin TraA [Duffyella gerundensis]
MKGTLSSCVSYCRKAGAVAWKNVNKTALFSLTAILASALMPAHAQDYFAGAKADVTDTFGGNSAVVYILYVIEIAFIAFTYIKTKNLALFGSIAALLVFVNVAFNVIPA